uniref:Uncharacterized protein LOC104226165 n=1 Tax=Nicotiana sylvestris TaxID=4096 RepID=A0A1U7W8P2_NICSY
LYNKYKDKGFEVLAFPCNKFLKQEPGTSQEAQEFACTRFQAEYPIFQKRDFTILREYTLKESLKTELHKSCYGEHGVTLDLEIIFCPPIFCASRTRKDNRVREERKLKLPRKAIANASKGMRMRRVKNKGLRERGGGDANAKKNEPPVPQFLILLCKHERVDANTKKEKGKP